MNRYLSLSVAAVVAMLGLSFTAGRADSGQISAERLNMLDKAGYFTPGFKSAVHDLVDTKHALQEANAEQAKLTKELPALEKQAAEAQAKTDALHQELIKYDHPEENDFNTLQIRMNDATAKPEEQIALAQAYVWTYPASPHEGQALQYLEQLKKNLDNQRQAEKEAEVARAAEHAKLVQRAQAHDLSLAEWRSFLRDMSQGDLVKLIGRPTSTSPAGDFWIYSGDWITDATTNQKVGMQIGFNAGRVLNVAEKPSPP